MEDIRAIQQELEKYNVDLVSRPQIIAANKIDSIITEEGEEDPVERIRRTFEPEGMKVFAISGVTGQGIKELLWDVWETLQKLPKKPVVYESEYEFMPQVEDLPYTVERDPKGVFVVEGPKIDKMLGYTNLESEKGFQFFQQFLKKSGVLDRLEEEGIEEGDTVRMYGHEFSYYRE